MLADNFVLNNAAAVAKTFNLTSQTGSSRIRLDISSTLAAPRTMQVVHQLVGSGTVAADRHTVSWQKRLDDANGVLQASTFSLVWTIPREVSVAAEILDLWTFGKNFLATAANVDAIARGES